MVLPTPPVPLKNHCSIIYNNVLYTYQVDAFQSLELKDGGTWTQLPMGVATNGSACVRGSVNDDGAFIVVGGTTNSSTQNYDGLQHYSFTSSKWQTDNPLDSVAMDRVGHGAAYLSQSSSILLYGGSQNSNNAPSSQTFLMETTPPYNVQAFNSDAPPVSDPLMLPFNATHALMLGGDPTNTKVFTFGPNEGWQQTNVSLQNGVKDSSKVQAALIGGSDGSKVLELFDMSTSPNQVSTLVLQNATTTSQSTKRSRSLSAHHPSKRRRRDTTLADRPAYNNTLAPQDSRDGFSLASDPNTGLVVATGGDDQVPLAMFNQTGNQWIDPNTFFGNEPSPTPSPTTAPTASPSNSTAPVAASSSAAAAANSHVRNKSLVILGGVLGGVFGFALLLVLALLLIRCCRKRREKRQREQHDSSYSLDNKAEMDFADVGADYMKEAGGTFEGNHRRNRSGNHPDTGVNIRGTERAGAASSQSKRALLHAKADSAGSGRSMWSRGTKSPDKDRTAPYISAPIMEPFDGHMGNTHAATSRASPDPRTEPRNDTGWSRYFTNNNSKDFNTAAAEQDQETRPATYLSQSDYTSRTASTHPHASAEVEPLSIRASENPFIYPPNSRVMSPTGFPRPTLGVALTHGRTPVHNDEPPSPTSFVSDIDEEDEYARHSHSDGQDSWTPVAASGERGSTYSDSRDPRDPPETRVARTSGMFRDSRLPHPGERVKIPNFPAVPDSQRASRRNSQNMSPTSPMNDDRGLRNIASKDFARSGHAEDLSVPHAGPGRLPDNVTYGGTQVRTFPRRKEDLGPRGRGGSQTEDMSWLNLGTSTEQANNHLHYASS